MARAKKVVVDETNTNEEVVASSKDTATVSWRGNTREFSRAIHGAGFADLARSFAEKVGGTIV